MILRSNLTDVDGLSSITSVKFLDIVGNDALENLDGLGALTEVEHELDIHGNDTLPDLDGLSALAVVGVELSIASNDELPDCEACELLGQLDSEPGSIDVHDNSDDSCTPVPEFCESTPCTDYVGDDPCCWTYNPCDWELNDICDCDSTCPWDAVDCEW